VDQGVSGQRKIGLLGGTFDPIHIGHLIAAEYAREAAGLDEVLFIPAGEPPHKESQLVTPVKHRYMMTLLATVTNPHFNVSRVEIERKGKSFTVDTVLALKEQYGASAELYFILGSDSMADVPNWHQPERLLSLCHFLVAGRPGWDRDKVKESLGPLYAPNSERIHMIEIPAVDISSSEIRARVREGRSIRYMVPDLVLSYIEERGLYRQGVAGATGDNAQREREISGEGQALEPRVVSPGGP
jgi:nicotinate-nucleotide adenylyltransferase